MISTLEEAKRTANQIALLEQELLSLDENHARYGQIVHELALLDGYLKDWDYREHGGQP